MNNLEKIRNQIRIEQDKMLSLSSSANRYLDFNLILMRVEYLSHLEAEELKKHNRDD